MFKKTRFVILFYILYTSESESEQAREIVIKYFIHKLLKDRLQLGKMACNLQENHSS